METLRTHLGLTFEDGVDGVLQVTLEMCVWWEKLKFREIKNNIKNLKCVQNKKKYVKQNNLLLKSFHFDFEVKKLQILEF